MFKIKYVIRSALLTLSMLVVMSPPAQAAMVGTDQLVSETAGKIELGSQREQIRQQLVDLGVEPTNADQRVASLSDTQVSEINHRLRDLPAGADAGSVILTVFIVFVITDVIGATDIFPFIKPVR